MEFKSTYQKPEVALLTLQAAGLVCVSGFEATVEEMNENNYSWEI